ncbi:hypothetical protein POSPLADRAFT_1058548 [Postia placenta MAD-698-R-SB12]|uniref:THO complex subunit 2 n=1 Tax=Postia placenta MAD-698-R-SB12 TaxID=670580 RepID=A0A1X6MVI7_9APHY|nr:hypothetical protein POSPLADRAFT_1058548 [Postia placenta MAD-698-R-SB12]OSX60384.1 hypothetical protein POSPLADRAFT_1058548 [Postia placenta MAD-698-R-SB12]
MEIVDEVQRSVAQWENGGSERCLQITAAPHANPTDPDCSDVLSTVYQALIVSTLLSWSPKTALTVDAFILFVQAVLERFPSSSSTSTKSSYVAAFGELLVDIFWSVDAELEEILADIRTVTTAADQANRQGSDAVDKDAVAKAVKSKHDAEADKAMLAGIIRRLLSIEVLDPDVCRERLDLALIADAGLIADKSTFDRKEIRTRTGLFYKQNKFNLLREQSEGYSKLVVELTSCLGPPHSSATGQPVESRAAIEARARPAWERVVGLIGYFDLDPNRALDVILDVFSAHLATHHSFFVSFLSFSPWAPRSKPVNSPDSDEAMAVDPDPPKYRGKTLDDVLSLAEDLSGKSAEDPQLPGPAHGNPSRVLAQVLGFKFAHYQHSEVTEPAPTSLYLMAAILIREDFISLDELYPHIAPTEDGMDESYQRYLAKVKERISSAKLSQLALAAPLESTGSAPSRSRPTASQEANKPSQPKELPNQKVGLLNALLAIGALRPAIAVMTKYPWIVDAYPEIADLMLRVLKHSIGPLYESLFAKDKMPNCAVPRARYGSSGVIPAPEPKRVLTLWAPTPPRTSSIQFVFFFPEWVQRIPVCSSLDDLEDVAEPLLQFVGLHISREPAFITKLLRLARNHLATTATFDHRSSGVLNREHPIQEFWYKALRRYVIPALPLIRANAVCAVEVWNILKLYEITLRWQLYGEWKTSIYQSHPELRCRQIQADRESKSLLRRLSSNTVDSLSSSVAKLAYSDPCIFFANAINQIMAYDNLADVVISALGYVTLMAFDVLCYITLDALATPNKERLKDDGVNIADWLQSLASFTGTLFRRYGADITALIKYIVHQLHNGQTTELIVLRELIWKMAGIEPLPSLSDSQIAAMAGGPTLRIEAVASTTRGSRLELNDIAQKAPRRLGYSLLETNLALPLLIQVAQQRQACIYQAPNAHLKPLASLYDVTHGVLLQYLELLNAPSIISPQEYAQKVVPPLAELSEKYGICAPICMQIVRPILNAALLSAALKMQEKERIASEEAEKRLKAALTAKREPNASTSRVASPSIGDSAAPADGVSETKATNPTDTPMADASLESSDSRVSVGPAPTENPWLPELYALFDDVKRIAPGNAAEVIGPGFYVSFWQLSTYDLTPPGARYEEELVTLRALAQQEDYQANVSERSMDRTKRQNGIQHRDRRSRYTAFVDMLGREYKEQTIARAFTIKRLAREKQHWFAHNPKAAVLASSFIEHCLQPRCLLSPMDADFCAQFIKVVHMQGTPGFSTLMCYDKILGDHIKVVIFSCSEYEAKNYGRFLLGVLTDLSKWFKDEQSFKQDNRTKSGGKITYLPGLQRKWSQKNIVAPEDLITWHDYKTIVKKWHRKLCRCLLDCIETGEFMHVYNAIIVLKEILPVFPVAAVNEFAGNMLHVAMERFLDKETRGDLKILGRAYTASLKKREPIWTAPKPQQRAPAARPANGTEKARGTPSTLSGSPDDGRQRANGPPASTPTAPRAQSNAVNGSSHVSQAQLTSTSTKLAMESIPRPEVVKRVRPEAKTSEQRQDVGIANGAKDEPMQVDVRRPETTPAALPTGPRVPPSERPSRDDNQLQSIPPSGPSNKDISRLSQSSRPPTPTQPLANRPTSARDIPKSPRMGPMDAKASRSEISQVMPPPSIPSQTLSAEKLRENAKQGRGSERSDEKPTQGPVDPVLGTQAWRAVLVEAAVLPVPMGIVVTKSEQNGIADKTPGSCLAATCNPMVEMTDDGNLTERKIQIVTERGAAIDMETEKGFANGTVIASATETAEKGSGIVTGTGTGIVEMRRTATERAERNEIPSTVARLLSHPSRRLSTIVVCLPGRIYRVIATCRIQMKEWARGGGPRTMRRKDREQAENEGKGLSIDTKFGDKRIPEGPASGKSLPPTTPSAPRAMATGDASRLTRSDSTSGRDREWKPRDPPPNAPTGPANSGGVTATQEASHGSLGSLRSRIGDKELPRAPAQASSDYRLEAGADRKPDSARDEERDGSRKRTLSERDKDSGESPLNPNEVMAQPPKRPRINRNRYSAVPAHGLAKKLLPIDPQAEKTRAGRNN